MLTTLGIVRRGATTTTELCTLASEVADKLHKCHPHSRARLASQRRSRSTSTSSSAIPLRVQLENDKSLVRTVAAATSVAVSATPGSATMPEPNHAAASERHLEAGPLFRFDRYDCLGFDLDNTICRYKVSNMVRMEYAALSSYLVEKAGFSSKYLGRPIEENVDFMIKGLILDVKKGNVLRLAPSGRILHGSHGTRELTQPELVAYYGAEMRWDVTDVFIKNPLHTWNGPLSHTMRTLLDYFDMPASLAFARAVDTLDEENGGPCDSYDIYTHMQAALQDMFQKEHFLADKGGYFPNIKADPEHYIHKCSDALIAWFKQLKAAKKVLFLITGSNIDFASHTASLSLGADWRELFDIVICYAKKPGFFTQERPFYALDGFIETHEIGVEELRRGEIYTCGNWNGLHKFLQKQSGKQEPAIVYMGDHLIQDVYTPSTHTGCHTVAICEELAAEGAFGHEQDHHDDDFLLSNVWGSYFHHGEEEHIWTHFIRQHAQLAVPSLEYVAKYPISHEFFKFQHRNAPES